jgi:hypothetical protein
MYPVRSVPPSHVSRSPLICPRSPPLICPSLAYVRATPALYGIRRHGPDARIGSRPSQEPGPGPTSALPRRGTGGRGSPTGGLGSHKPARHPRYRERPPEQMRINGLGERGEIRDRSPPGQPLFVKHLAA